MKGGNLVTLLLSSDSTGLTRICRSCRSLFQNCYKSSYTLINPVVLITWIPRPVLFCTFVQQKNSESSTRPSFSTTMGLRCHFSFLRLIIGLLVYCCDSTPALNITKFTLFRHEMTLQTNVSALIPCMFQSDQPIDPVLLELQWGKIPVDGGRYTPLIFMYGDGIKILLETKHKYDLFDSLLPTGNCTLIITPNSMADSGIYEVYLKVNGEIYEPTFNISITVLDLIEPSGVSQALDPWKGGKDAEKEETKAMTTSTPIMTTIMMTAEPMPITIEDYLDSVIFRNLRGNSSDLFDSLIVSKLKGHERTSVIVAMAVLSFLLLTSLISLVGCSLRFQEMNLNLLRGRMMMMMKKKGK
ncbi:uncharacterized protein LOC108719844 isoform X3 [Xenopus laevis]|uniref:Uncharacterized protein LOC108719844 isoform X3 n=1 Tax=Xenopus laevis TaxID=8355 RepID=A0A8J1L191_XENLA|nr:uncharacterized protein LOC108719844 isoform X3 [Xenopus laevis]